MIYLVRHGQTTYNQKRLFYGATDVPLSSKGKEQARKIGSILSDVSLDLVYTSTLQRTKETAEIILEQQPVATLPLHSCSLINEWDMGSWEGLNADEIEERYPKDWAHYMTYPLHTTPQGAEDQETYHQRVLKGYREIFKTLSPSQNVLLVGHQGPMRTLDKELFLDPRDYWSISFEQGHVYQVNLDDLHGQPLGSVPLELKAFDG